MCDKYYSYIRATFIFSLVGAALTLITPYIFILPDKIYTVVTFSNFGFWFLALFLHMLQVWHTNKPFCFDSLANSVDLGEVLELESTPDLIKRKLEELREIPDLELEVMYDESFSNSSGTQLLWHVHARHDGAPQSYLVYSWESFDTTKPR